MLYVNSYELNKAKTDAFNSGFKSDEIALNFTGCTDALLQAVFLEMPVYYMKAFKYGAYDDVLFNTTQMLMNSTMWLNNCTKTTQQLYMYSLNEINYYGSQSKYQEAVTLNMLANAARVQHITTELKKLNITTQEGQIQQAYYFGTLANIVLILPHSDWDPTADEQSSGGLDELDGLFDDITNQQSDSDFMEDDEWLLRAVRLDQTSSDQENNIVD